MKKGIKILSLTAVLLIGMSAMVIQNDKLFEITKNIEIFANTFQKLNTNYVDEIDPSELMRIGIDAMVSSLDPYTNYISESQIESYRLANEGKYQGMGVIIEKVGDYITIIEAYEDGPAIKAGLKAGDQIVEVNGFRTKGKTTDEMNAIAKGVAGTTVNLKIKRTGEKEEMDVELIRGETIIPNVPYSGRVADNIGYISLTTFTGDASKNISNALKELKKDGGLDGVILDLRYNGGGLLREAIAICNIFLPQGLDVVSTKGKIKERDRTFQTMRPAIDPDIPIVVLTNKRSASASEIVSGVLQDYDRGVVMGQRTFGKGLVQNTEEIGYNSRVKLTTSKYYIPSRRCIQAVKYENGVPVDIPDSERSKFKTANGRVVLDGGGVTPDVKLPAKEQSEYTKALISQHIVFNYINTFVLSHDSIKAPGEFVFNDFAGFKTFVKESGFEFESELESKINEIKKESEKELSTEFDLLLAKLNGLQEQSLDEYEEEITKEIEMQIISRYYFQSGKAKQKLNGDSEIQEAITLLNDSERYNKILGK
ncbi:MAG: S41 family peptidase [Saprospiraceae bacterium]|nr:S41 family peptidase [Saprospiraceae bacterium]